MHEGVEEQQSDIKDDRKPKPKLPIGVSIIGILSLIVAGLKIFNSVDLIGQDYEVRLLAFRLPATAIAVINLLEGICFAAAGVLLLLVKDLGRLLFTIVAVTQCILGIATGIPMITKDAKGVGYVIGMVLIVSVLAYAISYLYSDKVDSHFYNDEQRKTGTG